MRKVICEKLQHYSNGNIQLKENYSGRGMSEKITTGITCNGIGVIFIALSNWMDQIQQKEVPLFSEALKDLVNLRQEHRGLDIIFY